MGTHYRHRLRLTAHLRTPLENISKPYYFHYQFRARNSSLLTL